MVLQVLDTLFVKLKDPPLRVEVPGLPENVVPVYPTTTNINAMLPNDEKFLIARTQVEVLVNFAMTDFASQGKTRRWNVCDLNNLRSHQSYYTALSRSATAEGTLILQGFDPKVITGRCSGAMRQEFRELELLDEITRLRYLRKLPISIDGDTRNSLIVAFREWKGEQYVPQNVHLSIRWSKHNPWLESEILSVDERLELLEKLRKAKADKKGERKKGNVFALPDKTPSLPITVDVRKPGKRRQSSGLHAHTQRRTSLEVSARAATKQRVVGSSNLNNARHYEVPIGCRWSQNSCAYDSLFTPVFMLWCSDRGTWKQRLEDIGNPVLNLLLNGFSRYENAEISLENARDDARRLIARGSDGLPFGRNTSLENVCFRFLSTNKVVSERYYVCPGGHRVHHSNDKSAVLSEDDECESIAQWISPETSLTNTRCQICSHVVNIKLKFVYAPPLLAFSFKYPNSGIRIDASFDLSIESSIQTYMLVAVVYYADLHFTAQIITRDGRIWYYDGLALANPNVPPTLECVGTIRDHPDLKMCRGGQASIAMYVKQ